MLKKLEYEKIYEKIYREIYESYFPALEPTNTEYKLPNNYKELLEIGMDKLVIKIPEDAIFNKKETDNINIKGESFNKLYGGYKNKNFYCRMQLNPAKTYWGNNYKNLRDSESIKRVFMQITKELTNYGISIDFEKCQLYSVEANKMIMIDRKDINEKTISILINEVAKGSFKHKCRMYKESTKTVAFLIGTKNSSVQGYDKTLEVIENQSLNTGNKSKSGRMKALKNISKQYKMFFRIEAKRGDGSLINILDDKEINLGYFIANSESIIDKIFNKTISDSGLTMSNINKINEVRVRSLAYHLKKYVKSHQKSFVLRFIKDYQSKIWGVSQLHDVVDRMGINRQLKYSRKKSLRKEYEATINHENEHLDSFQCLKNIVENI